MSPALLRILSCLLRGLNANELINVYVCDCVLVWHRYRKITCVIFLPFMARKLVLSMYLVLWKRKWKRDGYVTLRLTFDVHQQPPRSPFTVIESSFSVTWKKKRGLYGATGGKQPVWNIHQGDSVCLEAELQFLSFSFSWEPGCGLNFPAWQTTSLHPLHPLSSSQALLFHCTGRWKLQTRGCYVIVSLFIMLIKLRATSSCLCPFAPRVRSSCSFAFCAGYYGLILLVNWAIYKSRRSALPPLNANCGSLTMKQRLSCFVPFEA